MSTVVDPMEVFKATFQQKDSMKQEAEQAKNFTKTDYEQIVYEGLKIDSPTIFRIMGYPLEYRQSPTDVKLILQSKIVKDGNKGYCIINWPVINNNKGKYTYDPDWILSRLYNTVMERKFVKYTDSDIDGKEIVKKEDGSIKNSRGYEGRYVYLHTNTKSYQRINNNKVESDQKSFNKFDPALRVLMNVISRMDDWCKINKHTKVLSTAVGKKDIVNSEGQNETIFFPQTGVSKSMYDELLTFIRNSCQTWFDRDFIITRTHQNDKYSQTILDGTALKTLKQGNADLWPLISEAPTTEEENSYKLYDFDKLLPVSSYNKLKRDLIGLFKLVDSEFGTSFSEELLACAVEEEKKRKENSTEDTADVEQDQPEHAFDVDETPAKQEPERRTRATVEPVSANSDDITKLPFFKNLEDVDQKALINNTEKFVNGEMVFKAGTPIAPCIACKKTLPHSVLRCPYCDTDL